MKKIFARNRKGKEDFLNLKAERIRINLKAEKVAKDLGITRQWLYKLEYNITTPSETLKKAIVEYFNLSWEHLSTKYEGGLINERICPTCKRPIETCNTK